MTIVLISKLARLKSDPIADAILVEYMEPLGDFELLQQATDKLHKFFQFDEENELRSAVKNIPQNDDLLYWPDPYKSNWEPQFQNVDYAKFPDAIHNDFSQVESASFMGILPELNRAWISVDNRLYLWDYTSPGSYTLYNGLSDVIVSVALATPKPDIFTDVVKYVLVVATTVEVVLLAVTWRQTDGSRQELKLQNTQYTISTDNNTIFKIACSTKGRIFLAGNDRNLYELVYENDNDSWKAMLGLDAPFKCRKVSHSNWSLVNVLDPVFRVFGGVEDGLVDLAVDDARGILYGVSVSGNLSLFYLGRDGTAAISTSSGFDIIARVQEHLISRSSISRSSGVVDPSTLQVASLHVVEPTESLNVHLVVIMSSGARVYLCVNTSYGKPVVNSSDTPHGLQIISIRNPPSSRKVSDLVPADSEGDRDVRPPGSDLSSPVTAAFYSHGIDVFATSNRSSDVVVGIGTDFIIRRSGHTVNSEPLRTLTESVCVVDCSPRTKRIYDIRESCPHLRDPSKSALRTLFVCSSSVPCLGASNSSGSNVASYQWGRSTGTDTEVVPVGPPATLPSSTWGRSDIKCGVSRGDLDSGIVAPLSEMVLQHAPLGSFSQRRIICLGNSGVHTLIKLRPADYLFRMLSRSNTSSYRSDFPVDYLADVGSFFEQYGSLHAASMCFGLACGLPGDAGGDVRSLQDTTLSVSVGLSTLQRRAISAVLRYTDSPSYSGNGQGADAQQGDVRQSLLLSGVTQIADPRVVPGVSPVCYSACHNGLYLLTSRLMRPVWSKILVGSKGAVKHEGSGKERNGHQLMLRRQDLDILIRPIYHLVQVLREYFGPTLAGAEGAHNAAIAQAASGSVVQKSVSEPGSLVSKQLASLNGAVKISTEGTSSRKQEQKPQETFESFAKKQEDLSIFRCYRLLCRSVQALHLLDIFSTAADEYGIQVPWAALSGVNFCSLVTSPSVQTTVKTMVHSVVSKVSSGSADPLVSLIDDNCFMYFSVGDRLAFEASKVLSQAQDSLANDSNSNEKDVLIAKAIRLLLQACLYWQSQECVEVKGTASVLADFCERLRILGTTECYDGIVDITLKAANNFRALDNSSCTSEGFVTTADGGLSATYPLESIGGDRGLYHGGGSPPGTELEREKFRCSCYDCLLVILRELLNSQKDGLGGGVRHSVGPSGDGVTLGIVFRMITRAAASSEDVQFHSKLYSCLMAENRDMLIRIDSRFIESFLLEQDPLLTYSYYTFHAMYSKAAQLMDVRAHIQGEELSLDDRIQDLSRAVSSAQRAVAACREARGPTAAAVGFLSELEEKLDIAELQKLVLTALSSKLSLIRNIADTLLSQEEMASMKSLEDIVSRLGDRLWSVSELYNHVTEPYELWDLSLIILHSCKHDDPQLIRSLWISVIYRIVPMRSNIPVIQHFLVDKKKCLMKSRRRFDTEDALCFEDSPATWIHELQGAIVDLGYRLCREGSVSWMSSENDRSNRLPVTGNDSVCPTFPVALLVEELEDIAALLLAAIESGKIVESAACMERTWVSKCLQRVGTSYYVLVEAYMAALQCSQGKTAEKKLQLLSSASSMLLDWTKLASGYSASKSKEARQLLDCARAGKVRLWIETIGQNIASLTGSTRLLSEGSSGDVFGGIVESIRLAYKTML